VVTLVHQVPKSLLLRLRRIRQRLEAGEEVGGRQGEEAWMVELLELLQVAHFREPHAIEQGERERASERAREEREREKERERERERD
jgi:hypothetical protein